MKPPLTHQDIIRRINALTQLAKQNNTQEATAR